MNRAVEGIIVSESYMYPAVFLLISFDFPWPSKKFNTVTSLSINDLYLLLDYLSVIRKIMRKSSSCKPLHKGPHLT